MLRDTYSKTDKAKITATVVLAVVAVMLLILSSCQKETTDRYSQKGEQSAQMSAEQRLEDAIVLVSR